MNSARLLRLHTTSHWAWCEVKFRKNSALRELHAFSAGKRGAEKIGPPEEVRLPTVASALHCRVLPRGFLQRLERVQRALHQPGLPLLVFRAADQFIRLAGYGPQRVAQSHHLRHRCASGGNEGALAYSVSIVVNRPGNETAACVERRARRAAFLSVGNCHPARGVAIIGVRLSSRCECFSGATNLDSVVDSSSRPKAHPPSSWWRS